MKSYIIYLNLVLDCPDRATREQVKVARIKALKVAKDQFIKLIGTDFKSEDITIKKEQPIEEAVAIDINEKELERLINKLTKIDLVQVIDSCYYLPSEEPKEISSKEKMKKFLK